MKRQARTNPPPDPRRAVGPSAWLSMGLLLVAALSGLYAASSDFAATLHGILVALALPVSLVAHLIAVVASQAAPTGAPAATDAAAPAGTRPPTA